MHISQHEDKSFKILIDYTMPDFLKALGIEDEIVIPLPTELMTTNCINRRLDYCGLSRNYEIINVEFQSTVLSKEDEIRIFDYASSLFVKHKLPVKTYIISTAEDKSRIIEKWHHNDVFTIYVISLKDKDGLESLNRIKSKIENNEAFNDEDIVLLISIVFMKSDLSERDLLFITADLTNKAKFELDFKKDQVKAIQLILGEKFIEDKEELKGFEEIVKMESGYLESVLGRYFEKDREEFREEGRLLGFGQGVKLGKKEGRRQGIKQGRRQGRKQGKKEGREEGNEERAIKVAHWMLDRNMSINDIEDATGLSVEKINSLNEK